MHLRPADFFTSNPALDVPSTKNQASVLVPCCGTSGKATNGNRQTSATDTKEKDASVQDDPLSHLQGNEPDVDLAKAGANVQNGNGNVKSEND